MADFCKQCCEELMGVSVDGEEIVNDMMGITTEEDTKNGLYAEVLCEGCGWILVDHTGKCVDLNCTNHTEGGGQGPQAPKEEA